MKLIKIDNVALNGLKEQQAEIERRQPYLKGVISPNIIIKMLLGHKKVRLTKYKYLERQK